MQKCIIIGTAYARMFMYNKAVIYYDEAYRTGQHEESKMQYSSFNYGKEG